MASRGRSLDGSRGSRSRGIGDLPAHTEYFSFHSVATRIHLLPLHIQNTHTSLQVSDLSCILLLSSSAPIVARLALVVACLSLVVARLALVVVRSVLPFSPPVWALLSPVWLLLLSLVWPLLSPVWLLLSSVWLLLSLFWPLFRSSLGSRTCSLGRHFTIHSPLHLFMGGLCTTVTHGFT